MYSSIVSAAILGVSCVPVQVEADVSNGLPMFSMVGYLSSRVREAQERVWTGLKNAGFAFPPKRITVNLSPADIKKEGTRFDLPIAAALLEAFGYLDKEKTQGVCMAGELGLSGQIKGVRGILPIVDTARKAGCRLCIVPRANLKETEFIEGFPILGVDSVQEFMSYAEQENWGAKENPRKEWNWRDTEKEGDFSEILGQEAAKRAAVIAAAGFHNILFIGTKGSGKTMLASRMAGIFPGMSREESMEVSRIYSIAGLLPEDRPLLMQRPFRSPHHTVTAKAMAGGGNFPVPGEITLAHKGILFLDELPEFRRESLEVLRQPLENRKICISRLGASYEFPADFLLAAAMNPCPCGYYPDMNRCTCTQSQVSRYLKKISGPLLDRFDLCTEMRDIPGEQLWEKERGKTSREIRKEIIRAHNLQKARYKNTGISFNSRLSGEDTEKYCPMEEDARLLLRKAYEKMGLSLRGYYKILKTARTIADLEEREIIGPEHISEAVFYRAMDKKYWK